MNNDTYLVLEICMRSYTFSEVDSYDVSTFIKNFADAIKSAGAVFRFFRLAVPDAKSHIGWRPTKCFMKIIAERLVRAERLRTINGYPSLLDALRSIVFPEFRVEDDHFLYAQGDLACAVFEQLGLLRQKDGKLLCTERLLDLLRNGQAARLS